MAFVSEQVRKGGTVAMLGDGINDAPALSVLTVGVAMGSGIDIARESADVVLIGNDLGKFVQTIRIARKCRQIILQISTER
jgi:P-type E1-E2 ATPase